MTTAPPVAADPVDALFARWRDAHDGRALASLFDRTAPDLFRIALSVAPDAATAEEAVQDTFLALIEEALPRDSAQPVMPWLVGVLRHKVIDARRRARRVPDPLRLPPRILPEDPAEGAARKEAVDRVRAALDRLPEPYRSVALLRWEYGLEPGEIAHARGEPPGTVRSTLSRALERLRADLGGAAALALVLGVRPPDGLAAIRRVVLARAGVPAGAASAGIVVAGILVGKLSAAAIVCAAFLAGGLAGGAVVAALRSGRTDAPADVAAAPRTTPAPAPARSRPGPRREPEADEPDPGIGPSPARAVTENAAPTAATGPDAAATSSVAAAIGHLDGTWATAWRVGQELAQLPSQRAVLLALRDAWPRIVDVTDRQNLLKGFDYDGGSPVRLDVLDLGARDPDPRVRWYALAYFEPYAGRRLTDAPEAWRTWREATAGMEPEALLDASAERVLATLRSAAPAERPDLVALLADVLARRGPACPARQSVLAAASGWYADPTWTRAPRPLAKVLAAARPADDDARALYGTLLAQGPEAERRALVLAGVLGARWAWGDAVTRLRSPDADLAAAAASALADLHDLRAVRPLVDAFDVHPDGRAAAAIASALQELTGVSSWRGKDAAWWREWWTRNGADVAMAPAAGETR